MNIVTDGIMAKACSAYAHVKKTIAKDSDMTKCARLFHRNKHYAYFVEARRLDEDGCLAGEMPCEENKGGTR